MLNLISLVSLNHSNLVFNFQGRKVLVLIAIPTVRPTWPAIDHMTKCNVSRGEPITKLTLKNDAHLTVFPLPKINAGASK